MRRIKDKLFPICVLLSGIYYLLSELITIYQTKEGLVSYHKRSISDLGILTTPFHTLMNSALIVNGLFYTIGISYIVKKRYSGYTWLLAVLTGISTIGVGLFPQDTILSFHYISTALVFSSGNILSIAVGLKETKKGLRIALISFGVIGLLSAFLIFFIKPLLPIFERLTVYPIVIFQITISIIYLMSNQEKHRLIY